MGCGGDIVTRRQPTHLTTDQVKTLSEVPGDEFTVTQIRPDATSLTWAVEDLRRVLLWGEGLDWPVWCLQLLIAWLMLGLAYAWFKRLQPGFADVL